MKSVHKALYVCVIAQSKMTEDKIPRMRAIWRTRTIVRIHHSMNVYCFFVVARFLVDLEYIYMSLRYFL